MARGVCVKCGAFVERSVAGCERCGGKLQSPVTIRILGAVLFSIGTVLVAGMAFLIVWAMGAVANADDISSGSRFNGTRSDMLLVFGIFGFVLLFGLTSIVAGAWQLIFGRRNRPLVWIILAFGGILLAGGIIVQYLE